MKNVTKTCCVLLCLLFLSSGAIAQTNKSIGRSAKSNSERRGGSGGGGDFWFILEGIELFAELLWLTGGAIGDAQRNVLEKEDYIPRITSLEVSAQHSIFPSKYQVFQPRIRAHRGLFSMDFRVFHNRETVLDEVYPYTSVDWQFLMINLITDEKVNFRMGTGIMSERALDPDIPTNDAYIRSSYNEHTFALDVYPGQRWRINTEGRFALDYSNNLTARREWNASVYYKLFQKKRVSWNLFGSAFHSRFYETTNVWAVSGGLSMTLE